MLVRLLPLFLRGTGLATEGMPAMKVRPTMCCMLPADGRTAPSAAPALDVPILCLGLRNFVSFKLDSIHRRPCHRKDPPIEASATPMGCEASSLCKSDPHALMSFLDNFGCWR